MELIIKAEPKTSRIFKLLAAHSARYSEEFNRETLPKEREEGGKDYAAIDTEGKV